MTRLPFLFTIRQMRELFDDEPGSTTEALELGAPERLAAPAATSWAPPPIVVAKPKVSPLVTLAEIPMTVWKRVAVYPALAWGLLWLFLPCRLNLGYTIALFAGSALGIAGAIHRFVRARDNES